MVEHLDRREVMNSQEESELREVMNSQEESELTEVRLARTSLTSSL